MTTQDSYNYNPVNKNNEIRDPKIFNYIPITEENKDYSKNIQLIKQYK